MLKYTLVLVEDTALSLPLKVVSLGTPLDYVLISMHFQLLKKQMFHFNQKILVLCMLVVMMDTLLTF